MSGFPSRAVPAAEPIPIGSCVPLTRATNNPAFLPVGSLVQRASYPELSARYPRGAGLALSSSTIPSRYFRNMAADGARIVAIPSDAAAISYSDDGGVTWVEGSLPVGSGWAGIAYGGGVWVATKAATAASDVAAASPDGITWTQRTMPSSRGWYNVAYGGGRFVTAAWGSSAAAYSADGVTWTESTLPSNGDWYGITYGNGRFVAVRGGSSAAAYSTDGGETWTASTLPASGSWYTVCYWNGLFLTTNQSTNMAATSPDGITWTQRTMPSSQTWRVPPLGGGGAFFAYAYNALLFATSPDGVTWTVSSTTNHGTPAREAAVYADGRYVVPFNAASKVDIAVPDGPGATHMLLGGPAGYHVRVR